MSSQDPSRKEAPPAEDAPRVPPWAALRSPQYRVLMGTFSFGSVGLEMRLATNLYVIYLLSGEALQVAFLGMFQFVPLVVFGLLGGSLADMFDRRKLLVVAQGASLATAAVLAALAFGGLLQVWHIYVATLVTAATNIFDQPARMGLVYASVPRHHLMNAVTMNTSVRYATAMLGPVLGGTLVELTGAQGAYGTNAVILLPAVVGLLCLRVQGSAPPRTGRSAMAPKEMVAGFRFFFSTQIILALIIMDLVGTMFTAHRAVMPIFAEDILQVDGIAFGLLMGAPAAGFVVGSLVLLVVGDVRRKGVLVVVTFIGYALAVAMFATSRSFPLSLVAMALVGGLDGIGVITRQTTLQILVPEEIRGRATAALQITNRSAPSLGFIVTGFMAALLGAPQALLVGSGLTFAVVLLVTVFWREVTRFKT